MYTAPMLRNLALGTRLVIGLVVAQAAMAQTHVPDGEWHHLALSVDQTSVRIYLDGILHKKRDRRPDEGLPIGNVSIASKTSHPKFLLDELSVYERALNPEEIKRLSQLATASVK